MRGACVQYEVEGESRSVLKELSFTIESGESVAIVGRNGSGKTTLLRSLAGLQALDRGSVEYIGAEVDQEPVIGWMPQDYRSALYPWWPVQENIIVGTSRSDLTSSDQDYISTILDNAGIQRDGYPYRLSGGQKQIVCFLRAVFRPKLELVLLDEPFSALDVRHRLELRNVLKEQNEAKSFSSVMVTHDLVEAVYVADRVLLLTEDSAGGTFLRAFPTSGVEKGKDLGHGEKELMKVVDEIEQYVEEAHDVDSRS